MRRRFFVERFENGRTVMVGEAAEHVGRVLRAQPGQVYELSDGRELWLGEVEKIFKREVIFRLLERLPIPAAKVHTTLLLSIVKFDRFEWCLEKATELGITTIIPLSAARSEKGLLAAVPKRAERWRKILIESAQQCRRMGPPQLQALTGVREAASLGESVGMRLLLSERASAVRLRVRLDGANATHVILAIGPEGGWTEPEFDVFASAGFAEVSLGSLILRTETAVISALASIQYALGGDS